MFDTSSSLPPFVGGGGGLMCESVRHYHFDKNIPVSVIKLTLLSDHFDGNQSMEPVDMERTCHPSPSLTTFVFRSSEVRRLLL